MLYGLRQTPPRSADYLDVLEAMRAPLHFLQESLGKRYSSRPVAPGSTEDGVLRQVVALWMAMAQAYAQAAEKADLHPLTDAQLALVCQRCVLYASRAVIEYFRARRTLPRGLWLELHGYYSTAEEWGFATQPVADSLKEGGYPQSAAESYCSVLLVDLANPYGRSPREFEWVCRWADQYAGLTEIMFTVLPTPAPPNRPILPPLANGQIRSITLMPVGSRSTDGLSSSNFGAFW